MYKNSFLIWGEATQLYFFIVLLIWETTKNQLLLGLVIMESAALAQSSVSLKPFSLKSIETAFIIFQDDTDSSKLCQDV